MKIHLLRTGLEWKPTPENTLFLANGARITRFYCVEYWWVEKSAELENTGALSSDSCPYGARSVRAHTGVFEMLNWS